MRPWSSNDGLGDVDSYLSKAETDGETDEGTVEASHPGRDGHSKASLFITRIAQDCPLAY